MFPATVAPVLPGGSLSPALPRLPAPWPSGRLHPVLPPKRVVRLAGAPFRVYPFETRRVEDARSAPPRTIGYAAVQTGARDRLVPVGADEAVAVCLRGGGAADTGESAKEKVIFCSRQGETHVYQADRQNGSAALCACGNATGASAALLAHVLGVPAVRQQAVLPDGRVGMCSQVTPTADGGWLVDQAWTGCQLRATPARLLGRDVAVCTGTFNDYLVVRLADRNELEALDLAEVRALWEAGRQFSCFEDPLRSRLAALAPGESLPRARFFTCGRLHPGAPLTGLAALALTGGQVPWLAALLADGRIEHRRGVDALPQLGDNGSGVEVHFPAIHVLLHGA